MKKIIFLIVLFPALAFGQSPSVNTDLKKSAETFIVNFLKALEDQKWEDVLNSINEEAVTITPNHSIRPLHAAMTTSIENIKKNNIRTKIVVGSVSADVLSPTSSLVTVMYLSTTENSGNIVKKDNLNVYLLELKNGKWQIVKTIPQETFPVTFSEKIDSKLQPGIMGPLPRFNGALGQMNGLFMYFIEDFKSKGIKPAQMGTNIGKRFAQGWDQSKGFEGLISGFLWGMQFTASEIEVIERSDNVLKIRYLNGFQQNLEFWNLSNKDIVDVFQNLFNEIANHMGGACSVIEDGKYLVLTVTKK